jgi:hypothetical protein
MRASIAVALLFAAVSAYAQGGGPPGPQWRHIRAHDGTFSFSMPGQPEYKTQTLTANNGHPVRYTTYTLEVGTSAYMASTSDYDSETRISLDGAIAGVLSSWQKPRIVERRTARLYGHPGQSVDFASGQFRVLVRAFIVGRRLYQLGFIERMDEFVPSHAERFMDSLRLH